MNVFNMVSNKDFCYKKNRLNQLRGFCAVVQNDCCVSQAATKGDMEQSTLSKQIMALERDLGIKLFDRSKQKRLELTKEGKLFYKEASRYIYGIDNLFESFNENLKEFNDSYLNIASHYMPATYIFPDIINKLSNQEKFKNINIKIMEITKDEAIKRLTDKEIDLMYYPFDTNDEILNKFNSIKNIRHNHALILSKEHPLANKEVITIKDLSSYDLLARDEKLSSAIDDYNLKHPNITLEDCDINTNIEFARYTNSIIITTEEMFTQGNLKYNPDIVCRNINHLFSENYFYALTLKNAVLKDSVQFILNELEKNVK